MLSSTKQFPSDPATSSALALNLGSHTTPTTSGSTVAMARYPRILRLVCIHDIGQTDVWWFRSRGMAPHKCQDLHNQASRHPHETTMQLYLAMSNVM
ncbi:hypothetical protein BM1_04654 [Bipolaris maydis]|nr:hypothetical protein BM1_04654 [Bipolaris maydis]